MILAKLCQIAFVQKLKHEIKNALGADAHGNIGLAHHDLLDQLAKHAGLMRREDLVEHGLKGSQPLRH